MRTLVNTGQYELPRRRFQGGGSRLKPAPRLPARLLAPPILLALSGCLQPPPSTGVELSAQSPQGGGEFRHSAFPHGYAIGDLTSRSALLWFQGAQAGPVEVQWRPAAAADSTAWHSLTVALSPERDLAATVPLTGLEPATSYRFRVQPVATPGQPISKRLMMDAVDGAFTTAPALAQPVTFVWSADLGGQQRCRREERGYPIFETIRQAGPAFALILGDTIYGDDRCAAPPNQPGSDFVAASLEQFRDKHRYQRGATDLRRFLREVPVVVTWDDHEVRNNFSGPHDSLMPAGRQAFFEYWPILGPSDEPFRLYRSIRWGQDVELFVLDTRQYRSSNTEPDGPDKSMLGAAQRDWLLDGLRRSTATWKFIVSSVPVSIPKPGSKLIPGIDSWAKGADGTGFGHELARIARVIADQPIRNVVWLTADVHFPQINAYDVDGDGSPEFHEFVAGPLSANPGRHASLDPTFHPTTLYTDTGFYNFGIVTVAGDELRVEIREDNGAVRFRTTFRAHSPAKS